MGSSPLTRGKRRRLGDGRRHQRLIPAHAGKTACDATSTTTARAHPRSRGENGYLSVFRVTGLGSSPLTRGKPVEDVSGRDAGRLIPAHAGKTAATARAAPSSEAHPRSRGENALISVSLGADMGSSPLTRGKPSAIRVARDALGLIPAHAGKTLTMTFRLDRLGAHPRSRGENLLRFVIE